MARWWVGVVSVGWPLACAGRPSEPARSAAPVSAPAPTGAASATDMNETVRGVYALYQPGAPEIRQNIPPWYPVATSELQKTWEWAVREAVDACGVPSIYQIDVVTGAQDWKIEQLKVEGAPSGDRGTATARFQSFGKPVEVRFDMRLEDGVWKIDDIHPPEGENLRIRIRDTVVAGDC